jgi:hypothetical protein
MTKVAGSGSGSISQRYGSADLRIRIRIQIRIQIRIRIHPKMSWIRNTAFMCKMSATINDESLVTVTLYRMVFTFCFVYSGVVILNQFNKTGFLIQISFA